MNRTLLKLPIISFLILLPVLSYVTYVSICRDGVWHWEVWIPLLFIGSSIVEGMYLNRQMNRNGFRQLYLKKWANKIEVGLTFFSIVMGLLCLAFGLFNYYFPSSAQSLPLLLAIWIIVMAILLPLDIAGFYQDKKKAIILSAIAAWAFCIVFPMHMFQRPTHRKWTGFAASASIIVALVGLTFWLLGDNNLNR